jgi:hypothetical protein
MNYEVLIGGERAVVTSKKQLRDLMTRQSALPKLPSEPADAFVDGIIFGFQMQDQLRQVHAVNGTGVKKLWFDVYVWEAVYGNDGLAPNEMKMKLSSLKKEDSKGYREKIRTALKRVQKSEPLTKQLVDKGVDLEDRYKFYEI